jgi:hypothetical protein
MSLRVLLLVSGLVACRAVTEYNPPEAGQALDALEKALGNIINSPHLSKEQLTQAKKVSADVEKTVVELESAEGKKLTKEAKATKVRAAIGELQQMQGDWQKAADKLIAGKKDDLMKKLKEKQAELVKDEKMLKVIKLEKALAEKKLSLQKLIDSKNNEKAAKAQKEAEKDAAAQQEMVANVLKVAKTLKEAKPSAAKPADADKLKGAVTYLEGRVKTVQAKLDAMDAEEKKREDELTATLSVKIPVKDANDPMAKSQGILKMLMKKEHRNYEKARAGVKQELNELHSAVTSINKGDADALTKIMSHMQGEMKSAQAKSHKFLY